MITAHLFIDWDTARRVCRAEEKFNNPKDQLKDLTVQVEQCFSILQDRVLNCLEKIEPNEHIKILKSRVYHGWHRGSTATLDRRAWDEARRNIRARSSRKISFLPDIEFGNVLTVGGERMPIYDTLRFREDIKVDQQKMVDTALVVDVLSFCRTESKNFKRGEKPESMVLIVGDDDDLLPAAFVAEAWGMPAYVLRVSRRSDNKHNNIINLVHRL